MNHVYRVIWSHARNAWVVVSDLASSCGKRSRGKGRGRVTAKTAKPTLAHATLLISFLAALPATAADLYWDTNGTSAGLGSAFGTWNTANTFWTTNSLGTSGHQSWANGNLDNAIFANTSGSTVTLGGPISIHNLTFQNSGYNITGNTLTLGGTTPTITNTGAFSNTISSILAGTNGMTFTGGTLALSAANTLTGGITINSGRLITTNNANNILNGANNVVTINNGGILEIQNANAFGGNTAASNLVMNDGSRLLFTNINLAHGVTANGGTIIIQDESAACCSSNTWTGALTLNANTTLRVNNTGGSRYYGTIFAGSLTDTGANLLSLALDASNGYLTLSGNNSFTGGITVNNGVLDLTGVNSAGAATNVVTVNNGGTLRVSNANAFANNTASNLILNNGGRFVVHNATVAHDVQLASTAGTVDGTGSATWSGTAVLTPAVNATLTLGGTSTLDQSTNLTATGSLFDNGAVLSVTTAGGVSSNVRFAGPLSFSGNFTVGSSTWLNTGGTFTYAGETIINDGGLLWLNSATPLSSNTNIRFQGVVPSGVTVVGLTTRYPTYTQPIGSSDGQISWTGNGGFYARQGEADASVNLFGNATPQSLTWDVGGFVPTGSMLILGTDSSDSSARELNFRNSIDLNAGLRSVRADGGTASDHAVITGQLFGAGGGLRVLGTGALELRNANNIYTGATVIGDGATSGWGNLILGTSGALPSASNLQFNGVVDGEIMGTGGVVILTSASDNFTRALGTGADQVRWTTSGGFAALDGVRTVNIGGIGETLTWGGANFVPTGQALRFGSTLMLSSTSLIATVDFMNPIDLGAVDRVINVVENTSYPFPTNSIPEVSLNGAIQGTGGLNLRGMGDVRLNAANTFTGALTIGAASGTNNDDGMHVYAPTITDGGVASSLGQGSSVVLSSNGGALTYAGSTNASTNRSLTLRDNNGAMLGLRNEGAASLTWTGNVTTSLGSTSSSNTLALGGTYNAGDANVDGVADNPNVLSGVISDGVGTARLRVAGTATNSSLGSCGAGNVWRLTGANTFTGGFATEGCTFEVTSLTNAGSASSIGASANIATNLDLYNNGALRYIGSGDSTNRLLRVGSNSRIESSGTGALAFTGPGPIAFIWHDSIWNLWLGGANTNDNSFGLTLVNGPSPYIPSSSNFSLGKDGRGLWALPTNNNGQADAYTDNTRIVGGALRLDHAGAITGGLGAVSSHGATGSIERSSLIVFEGLNNSGFPTVLGLTAASGDFLRGTTSVGSAFENDNLTFSNYDDDNYVHGIRWAGSGGFAAWDGTRVVNLFGNDSSPVQVTWNSGGFVQTGHNLVFGYSTATGTVDFRNPINLAGTQRTFEVHRGLAASDAILSNVISGGGGIVKTANGILVLTADNTFTGNSAVTGGILQLGDGTAAGAGSLGTSPTVSVSASATLAVNHSDAHTLSHAINGDGTLHQMGTGTTSMTSNSDIDHVLVDAGRLTTTARLYAEDVTFADAGGASVEIGGILSRSAGTATLVTGGALNDTFIVAATGNATVNADLGDGNDVLDVGGTLNSGAGVFELGLGDDTFTIRDGATVTGSVNGGDGNDTFNTHVTTVATFGATQGFETLAKSGAGVLNITGPAASIFSTVNVLEGTIDVNALGILNPITSTVAAGATLNVDGTFDGDASANTMTVAGALSGSGAIDLQDGDDVLTLNDGASLSGFGGTLDGGAATTRDAVVLNNAAALTFAAGGVIGFEQLTKQNTGTATMSGDVAFTQGATVNGGTLAVDGQLETPTIALADDTTLQVAGIVQNAGAAAAAIMGTAGANAVRVAAGGVVLATGSLGDGSDTLDVAGTLDIGGGTFDLGAGDDSFVIHDGTNVVGTIIGGAGLDTRVYDLTGTANIGALQQFEGITKRNTGTLNINGPAMTDVVDVAVEGGTLNIVGGGLTGIQTALVAVGATLNVDDDISFTAGSDTLTVAGTVNGADTIDLLDGDDTLTLQDGADLGGLATSVDAGAGTDTLISDIAGTATLGGATNFEQLVKANVGTLNVDGPAASAFTSVAVQGGTLNVGAASSITGVATSSVAAGATLNVDGVFDGGTGNDTMTVSGTVTGNGTIDLQHGDDVLTLNDGANLSGLAVPLDGGTHVAGDTLVLNKATDMTLGAVDAPSGFEQLTKQHIGIATLSGAFAFTSGTVVNGGTLLVEDMLETPTLAIGDDATLEVAGAVQAAGAAPVAFTGSAGANTIRVGAAGMLAASGGLGDGADTLDVAGTLDLGGGTFDLGAGDDAFVIYDGTNVAGTVIGGAGMDTRVFDLAGTANLGALQEFEGLTKRDVGTLNITGPGLTQDLLDVRVEGGTLNIGAAGAIAGVQALEVAEGATLNVDGSFAFTTGADTFAVGGTVTGLGSIDLRDGDDALTLRDGADLSGLASSLAGGTGTDTFTADISAAATLGGATGFETLIKEGVGSLRIVGPAGSQFDTVLARDGVLEVAAGAVVDPQTTLVDAPATLIVDGAYEGTVGADTFTLSGTLAGAGVINLLADDDTFTLNTGATQEFAGLFDGAAGTDRFVLSGTDEDSFDLGLIDTTFQSFERFAKEGTGTWRLTGAGDHNWTIAAGTLIGDTVSFGGNIDNAGTVIFDQTADGIYDGVLSGDGTLIKQNAGALVLTGSSTFTGETELVSGALQVDGVLPGSITVASGTTLSGIGTVGHVTAATGGFVAPGNAADPFGTLTVAGDYAGGTVGINTVLGNQTSMTSRLAIQGSTSGTSAVVVTNVGGTGARTTGDGIEIIQVDGTSAAGSFNLSQPVQAGAYEYLLHQGGTTDPNDWFLRSQFTGEGSETGADEGPGGSAFRPGVAGYVLGHQVSLEYGFAALSTLRERVGSQGRVLDPNGVSDVWMRASTDEIDLRAARFIAEDLQMSMLQFGGDVYRSESAKGGAHVGAMVSLGRSSTTFFDPMRSLGGLDTRAGRMETDAGGAGLYWTLYGEHGGYLDLTAQVLHHSNHYRDQYLDDSTQHGWVGAFSAELGAAYTLGSSSWKLEPQLQLAYQQLELDDFDDNVSHVASIAEDALRVRAGVQLFRAAGDWLGMRNASPYVGIGVQKDLIDVEAAVVGGSAISDEIPDTTVDASIGFVGSIVGGIELHLDARYQQATEGEKDGVRGNFGFRKGF